MMIFGSKSDLCTFPAGGKLSSLKIFIWGKTCLEEGVEGSGVEGGGGKNCTFYSLSLENPDPTCSNCR